jgi:hypothetical protein
LDRSASPIRSWRKHNAISTFHPLTESLAQQRARRLGVLV